MKKFSAVLVAGIASLVGFGSSAIAADYPPGAVLSATPTSGAPGYTVTVKAGNCTPPEVVTFSVSGDTKTATCAAPLGALGGGVATTTLTAPAAAGTYTVTGAGTLGYSASASITVVIPPTGNLPATGSNGVSSMTIIALGLFGVGAGLFGVAQVRRRQTLTV